MSQLCLVDISKTEMNFDELNDLAKQLVEIALKDNIAVFFHDCDYGYEIIKEAKMKNYFLMSDSFLYKNCDFLNTYFFKDFKDIEQCRKEFKEKFNFFNDILSCIFNHKVNQLDIYITMNCSINISDFDCLQCDKDNFIESLFKTIFDYADAYAYGFPDVKFTVYKSRTIL